jgi:hypothetical protein
VADKIDRINFEHQQFFVDGPKGEGRTARITRDWSAMCQFTLIQDKAVKFEYGEMAEWLKALPC